MKLPNFIILTGVSVMDITYENEEQHEHDCLELMFEQNNILTLNGIYFDKCYNIHIFDSPYTTELTMFDGIEEASQYLAIKDGCDLVRFENGNIGFVAYYNGHKNGFEIIQNI